MSGDTQGVCTMLPLMRLVMMTCTDRAAAILCEPVIADVNLE